VVGVIGGLYWLEGAWIGALLFTVLDNYSRTWLPSIGEWMGPDRFETVLGIIFLLIVLLSPGGLVGIWQRLRARVSRALGQRGTTVLMGPDGVAVVETERFAEAARPRE
jgi:hypothetical protein